ncbi:rolling circle replication-associated protein [Aquibacillus saliphilus]|uniref:rolling circle replication-associated protein n=1 Tax=Aquibacillus saliphilus TaxID=1909422 RepID=UPI001CF061CF|nr:hypothetical protein [Aquibacillus saliphilus]
MKCRKLIVSGSVVEVFEYEKDPITITSKDDDDFNPFDYENTKLPELELKEKRRDQTVRDARNLTRRLALMNFNENDIFMTLTYKENEWDVQKTDLDFKNFLKRLKYRFKIKKVKYLAVREFQKRGAIHYHVLLDYNFKLPPLPVGWGYIKKDNKKILNDVARRYDNKYIKPLEREIGKNIWSHGFVDIKVMDKQNDNVGAYLIKYMTKGVAKEFYRGKKIYLCSKGLERPLEYRGLEANLIYETYNLEQKKEVFTNCYESEYLGQIIFKEFNLKRLEN